MSDDNTKTPGAGAGQEPSVAEAGEIKAAEDKPDLAAEVTRLRDQLLRTAADFDNFRKRTRRENDDAQKRGQQQVLKDLLPVFDNLERAAQHADTASDAKAVADGLRIVLKQFTNTLEKMGIRRIPTVGMPFDPAVHEAIQHVESPDQPAGIILHEVQAGYALGDLLLRAAMVIVSKGPARGDVLPS